MASSGKDIDQFLASVTSDDILEKVAGLNNSQKIQFVMREEIKGTLVNGRYSGFPSFPCVLYVTLG